MELEGAGGNIYTKEVEAFAHALLKGESVPMTAEDAISSQSVVEAAYRSSKDGVTVRL